MPLVTSIVVNEWQELMVPDEIQDEIQKAKVNQQVYQENEKRLGNWLLANVIDETQYKNMFAENKEKFDKASTLIIKLLELVSVDKDEEEKRIIDFLFAIRLKRIDKWDYKRYVHKIIEKITMYAYYIVIDFVNGKQLKLERIPHASARILPDWTLEVKDKKVYITYFYKSFYSGDSRVSVIFEDESMEIITVGKNPEPGAYLKKRSGLNSKRTQAFLKRIADI